MKSGIGLGGFRAALVATFVVTTLACSGKSESSGDEGDDGSGGTAGTGASGGTGGTGATGGTGGATGGSAGTSGQASKLGLYLMLRNPDPSVGEVAGKQCPALTGIEWDIGEPILQNGMVVDVDSPSPTDFGTTLADGESNASILCTVTGAGAFNAEGGGTDPMMTPPNGVINFTLAGIASARGGPNVSGFAVYTPITLALRTADGFPLCSMVEHEIAPGAMWADIDCPALVDPTRPSVACHASGTIVVEYCSTQ